MYQLSSIKMGCFCWILRASSGWDEKSFASMNPGFAGLVIQVLRLFFGEKTAAEELFLKKSPVAREPFRGSDRITLSPTGPERRGQDGFERVGRLVANGLRGALGSRVRQGRPPARAPDNCRHG
jgi:hypothetical protein